MLIHYCLLPIKLVKTAESSGRIQHVKKDGKELGLDLETGLTNYCVVSHPEDFYSLEPNNDYLRPEQQTPSKDLFWLEIIPDNHFSQLWKVLSFRERLQLNSF